MKAIIRKPYQFFFALVPFFLVLSLFRKGAIIDLYIQNTPMAIDVPFLCYLSAAFFALIGINYYLLHWAKKPGRSSLTALHIIFLSPAILFFVYSMFSFTTKQEVGQQALPSFLNDNNLFSIAVILFILATLLHFINFFGSLLAKRE